MKFTYFVQRTAKEAFVKQTAFTNKSRTEVFLVWLTCFFPQILSTKPQSCSSFSFAYVSKGCYSGSCCRSICDRGQTLSQRSRLQNSSYSGSRRYRRFETHNRKLHVAIIKFTGLYAQILHKIHYQQLSLQIPHYYLPKTRPTRQYHHLHYILPTSSTTAYQNSYFSRTINEWNILPIADTDLFTARLQSYYCT